MRAMLRLLSLVLGLLGEAAIGQTALFSDTFNRPDGTAIGNGWTEFMYYNNQSGFNLFDNGSILASQLRFAKDRVGSNEDSGVYRPFAPTCGVNASGVVNWNGSPTAAAVIAVNSEVALMAQGLALVLAPAASGSHRLYIINDGLEIAAVEFPFDVSLPYRYEWAVRPDCSSDLRVWRSDQLRPPASSLSSPPVTLTLRSNRGLVVGVAGGSGCCSYPGYDVRFDDLVITADAATSADSVALVRVGVSFEFDSSPLQPGGGHAWIEELDLATGTRKTWGTYATTVRPPGTGKLYEDLELPRTFIGSRSMFVSGEQRARLQAEVARYRRLDDGAWRLLRPCTQFAVDGWRTVSKEAISVPRSTLGTGPLSAMPTPSGLEARLLQYNDGERHRTINACTGSRCSSPCPSPANICN